MFPWAILGIELDHCQYSFLMLENCELVHLWWRYPLELAILLPKLDTFFICCQVSKILWAAWPVVSWWFSTDLTYFYYSRYLRCLRCYCHSYCWYLILSIDHFYIVAGVFHEKNALLAVSLHNCFFLNLGGIYMDLQALPWSLVVPNYL